MKLFSVTLMRCGKRQFAALALRNTAHAVAGMRTRGGR